MKNLTIELTETAPRNGPARRRAFTLEASDITGTHFLEDQPVPRTTPAGELARTLAAQMSLPTNVPWSLRSDAGDFLEDSVAIGDQVEAGARVTVTPKTHLGGGE